MRRPPFIVRLRERTPRALPTVFLATALLFTVVGCAAKATEVTATAELGSSPDGASGPPGGSTPPVGTGGSSTTKPSSSSTSTTARRGTTTSTSRRSSTSTTASKADDRKVLEGALLNTTDFAALNPTVEGTVKDSATGLGFSDCPGVAETRSIPEATAAISGQQFKMDDGVNREFFSQTMIAARSEEDAADYAATYADPGVQECLAKDITSKQANIAYSVTVFDRPTSADDTVGFIISQSGAAQNVELTLVLVRQGRFMSVVIVSTTIVGSHVLADSTLSVASQKLLTAKEAAE